MFQDRIWLPVFDAMEGSSFISRLQRMTGLSRPTARKYLLGKISPRKRRQADLNAEDSVIKALINEGVSEKEAKGWFAAHPVFMGKGAGFQSVVYSYLGAESYPRLDVMAEKIDRAMSSLFSAFRENGIESIPLALEQLEGFSSDYMVSHDPERETESAEALSGKQKLEVFLRNACLSFFALMDVECLSRDYPEYQLSPIFINLTPRVSPYLRLGENFPRGGFVLPSFSLMEFLGLLVDRGRVGFWRRVPSVDDIASMANMNPSELAKIRSGFKRLSFKKFSSIWREMVRPLKSSRLDINRPPIEFYLVAVFFQVNFCGKSPSRWVDVVGYEYRYWWEHHKNALEADSRFVKGTKTLPEWFLESEFLTD